MQLGLKFSRCEVFICGFVSRMWLVVCIMWKYLIYKVSEMLIYSGQNLFGVNVVSNSISSRFGKVSMVFVKVVSMCLIQLLYQVVSKLMSILGMVVDSMFIIVSDSDSCVLCISCVSMLWLSWLQFSGWVRLGVFRKCVSCWCVGLVLISQGFSYVNSMISISSSMFVICVVFQCCVLGLSKQLEDRFMVGDVD